MIYHVHFVQAFGGTDYSFSSNTTTTSTPDSVHNAKRDLSIIQQSPQQQPTNVMKKKKSVVNLFSYNNLSELLSQQQQPPPCDTTISSNASKPRYDTFTNISFDTNLDFLSFVSLYRSFR